MIPITGPYAPHRCDTGCPQLLGRNEGWCQLRPLALFEILLAVVWGLHCMYSLSPCWSGQLRETFPLSEELKKHLHHQLMPSTVDSHLSKTKATLQSPLCWDTVISFATAVACHTLHHSLSSTSTSPLPISSQPYSILGSYWSITPMWKQSQKHKCKKKQTSLPQHTLSELGLKHAFSL